MTETNGSDTGIPIVIGVTGHRDLREQDIQMLRELVSNKLKQLMIQYPNSEFVMLNSIASGADTLCARIALELGIKLICPLPLPIQEYRKDFSEPDAAIFDTLLKNASEVFLAPNTEPLPDCQIRDFHYRQAGIYIAAHSHVLIALWDGMPAKPDGCGTAETVDFMYRGYYGNGYGCFKAANDGAVIHILTPRQSTKTDLNITDHLLENKTSSLRETLCMTDAFNADASNGDDRIAYAGVLLPEETMSNTDEKLKKLHMLYQTADRLSLRFQQKYLSAMRWFSIFGVLLVLFFLLYDELESNLFLLSYGALIIVYILAFTLVRRGNCHEKYLQYRMLSETLRVQFYLKATGLRDNIGNAFTWTQKQESTWIKEAVSALLIGEQSKHTVPVDAIKERWIDGQLTYHQNAFKRDSSKHHMNEGIAKWMLATSVLLFLLVLVLEFFSDSSMTGSIFSGSFPVLLLHHPDQELTLRSLMKLLLGGVSAITVFLANYYGKLSFERKSIDHEKMTGLFSSAKEQFESGKIDKKQLFRELAREEIIENGNWFSYCRENPPSFNL